MIFGWNKKVDRKLEKLAAPAIILNRAEMTSLIKNTKYEYMRVWSTKLDGQSMRRYMRTEDPTGRPSGNPNYIQKGQWVMYSQTNRGWRTIVLNTVKKVKLGNQMYKIG